MPPSTLERLRHAGLRVTKPRLSVLAAVESRPHADTLAIIDAVRADLGLSLIHISEPTRPY